MQLYAIDANGDKKDFRYSAFGYKNFSSNLFFLKRIERGVTKLLRKNIISSPKISKISIHFN